MVVNVRSVDPTISCMSCSHEVNGEFIVFASEFIIETTKRHGIDCIMG